MEIRVEAAPAAVTVYSERALVVRRVQVEIPEAGEHMIKLGGLPERLQRNSLRASGRGPAGTRILAIEQEAEIHAEPPVEALQRLEAEITRLRRAIELVDARQAIIEEQRQWLRTLGEQAARRMANGIAVNTARPEDASALFTFTGEESERLVSGKLALDTRREELQRELEARQRELRELSGSTRPDRIAASLRISTSAPGELSVELTYLIAGASWRPRYDARVDTTASQVQLVEQALVWQRTGEDWQSVELSLSTAQPEAAITLPDEPDPWYIDMEVAASTATVAGAVPMMPKMFHAAALRAPASFAKREIYSDVDLMEEEPAEVALATAPLERSGAVQVFRLPGSVDIPGGGAPRTVGLAEHGLPCRFDYVTAPVLAPGVHLRAIAANTTGAVLLPGELHIFQAGALSDEFVGATHLDRIAEGAEIKFYLGADDNITVKRELVERDTDKGSLLQSGIRRITFGYRVTLTNRSASAQRVVLLDRLPVSRHERVKLRVLDLRPQPTTRTRLEQLAWELQLAPEQQQRVEWRFVVEAPADVSLTGLP
jgi:uncharacterized protein (TIGR02231 family)